MKRRVFNINKYVQTCWQIGIYGDGLFWWHVGVVSVVCLYELSDSLSVATSHLQVKKQDNWRGILHNMSDQCSILDQKQLTIVYPLSFRKRTRSLNVNINMQGYF